MAVVVCVMCLSSWDDVVDRRRSGGAGVAAVSVLRGIPDEQRLLTKIQRNYDSRVRPVYNSTHRVTVKFALTLVQIIDVVSTSASTLSRGTLKLQDWTLQDWTIADWTMTGKFVGSQALTEL